MAGSSKVEVANMALVQIGQEPLLSFDSDTRNGEFIRNYYENCKQFILKLGDYSFATERQILNKNTQDPAFGWDHAYDLPAGFLNAQKVLDSNSKPIEDYEIESGKILTNSDSLYLVYTKDVGVELFTPDAVDFLVARLAMKIAYPITLSSSVKQRVYEEYKIAEEQMPTFDDKGTETVAVEDSDWEDAYGYS